MFMRYTKFPSTKPFFFNFIQCNIFKKTKDAVDY